MTVGERIKLKRKELGMTQEDLAKKLGYKNKSAVCRVERDYEQNLTLDRVALFAEALGVSAYYLMGWENTKYEYIAPDNEDLQRIVAISNQLDSEGVKVLLQYAEFLLVQQERQESNS